MTEHAELATGRALELERRRALVRRELVERELDALVVFGSQDYLGGSYRWVTDRPAYHGYYSFALVYPDRPITIIEHGNLGAERLLEDDPLYPGVDRVLNTAAFQSVLQTHRYEADLAIASLKRSGCRRVGLASMGAMPHAFVRALADEFSLHDLTPWLDLHKAVKSPYERDRIRSLAALQDEVFRRVLEQVRPGLHDRDIMGIVMREARHLGSEQGVVLVGSAPIGEAAIPFFPHRQNRRIEAGDHLTLLIEVNGPCGYYCELSRIICLGRAPSQLVDFMERARKLQERAVQRMRPGVSCAEVAALHDEALRTENLPPESRLFAHGQGYDLVERPLIRADETMALAAGMNIVCHPVLLSGKEVGLACDNFLIGENGAERIHRTPQKVFEL